METRKMKEKKNIKKTIFHGLLVYLILSVFSALLFFYGVDKIKGHLKEDSILASNDYTRIVEISNYASTKFRETLNDALETALLLAEEKSLDQAYEAIDLKDLAQKTKVDLLYIYNEEGIIINGTNEDNIGWQAPPTHDFHLSMGGFDKILHRPIRQATGEAPYFKYAYLKTDDNHVIQSAISAEKIHGLIDRLNPNNVIEQLKEEVQVVDAEIYFKDKETVNRIFSVFEMDDGQFQFKPLDTGVVSAQEVKLGNQKVLKINRPIILEGQHIGDLYIYRSLDLYKNLQKYFIVFTATTFFLYMGAIIWLTYLNISKQKEINAIAVYDEKTGLYSRHYFDEYLNENFETLINQQSTVVVLLCSNYNRLKLFLEEYTFNEFERLLVKETLANKKTDAYPFEYSEDVLVFFDKKFVTKEEYIQELQHYMALLESIDYYGNKVDLKMGILKIDDRYRTAHQISSNIANIISELRAANLETLIYFDDQIWDQLSENESIQNDMRRSFVKGFQKEFYLEFQPKIDAQNKEIIGFESLLRWRHPTKGMISPAIFIPLAEETNIIYHLSDFVIDEAIKFATMLIEKGYKDANVSFNVTYPQFKQAQFEEKLLRKVAIAGISPSNLALEVTESIMIDDFDMINEKLLRLKEYGFTIYLDDFGVGYSSLERIKDMYIDIIKIDRSFIQLIDKDIHLLESLFSLVENLDFKVIVEGVETRHQLDWLHQRGYHLIQGFYFSKSLKENDALKYLENFYKVETSEL